MKTNTRNIFILSFLSIVLISGAFWYVRQSIDKKINVISEYRNKELRNNSLETGAKIKEQLDTLNEQEQIIRKSFLQTDNVVSFIKDLELNAQNMGLEISVEKIDYGTPEIIETKYTIKPIIFNLQVNGSFSNIESFVNYLKNSENNLSIKEFKLYKNSGEVGPSYNSRIIISGVMLSYE